MGLRRGVGMGRGVRAEVGAGALVLGGGGFARGVAVTVVENGSGEASSLNTSGSVT